MGGWDRNAWAPEHRDQSRIQFRHSSYRNGGAARHYQPQCSRRRGSKAGLAVLELPRDGRGRQYHYGNGENVGGNLIGGPSPPTLVNNGTPSLSFRADITSFGLIGPSPNTLTVEDLSCNFSDDGVGAFVIFDDGRGSVFSGRATVARVTAAGLVNVRLVDTGPLPSSGGIREEELLNLNLLGILQSGTARAITVGAGDQSQSAASVERLTLSLLGLLSLQAGVIESVAKATCSAAGAASIQGASTLLNLTLNGNPIVISGAPNQTIDLNLGLARVTVIINEQVGSASGATGDLTVNALHVRATLLGIPLADVVLSSAHADIGCTVEPAANIQIRDGNDFAAAVLSPPGNVTVAQTFTFPSTSFSRTAKLALFVGNADADRPDVIEITVGALPVMRIVDNLRSPDGLRFDNPTFPVNIPAGVHHGQGQAGFHKGQHEPIDSRTRLDDLDTCGPARADPDAKERLQRSSDRGQGIGDR